MGPLSKRLGQPQERHAAGFENLACSQNRAFVGELAVLNQNCGIDRPVQDGGTQAGEKRAAVEENEVILASEPCHGAHPGGAREKVTGASDRGLQRQDRQVVIRRIDDGVGQRNSPLDNIIETDHGFEPQEPGEHGAREIGIHEQEAMRFASECAGKREQECRAALGSMATREENDLDILLALGVDELAVAMRSNRSPQPGSVS